MIKSDIERIFKNHLTIKLHTKPEVLKMILNHERKNLFIDNLCKQLRLVEKSYRPRKENVIRMIQDMAIMFGKNALREKEEQILSAAEKVRRIQKDNYIKDAETTFLKDQEKEAMSTASSVFVPGMRDK